MKTCIPNFQFHAPMVDVYEGTQGPLEAHHCMVNFFLRDDYLSLSGSPGKEPLKPVAAAVISQNPSDRLSIMDGCPAIAGEIFQRFLYEQGHFGVFPEQVVWILVFQPEPFSRKGQMQRTWFESQLISPCERKAQFAGPIWKTVNVGLVERVMGFNWDDMGFPRIVRYGGSSV